MAISEEMREALDILREDHVIKSFKTMTDTQKALVERMDKWESERQGSAGNGNESGNGGGAPESGQLEGDGKTPPSGAPEPPEEITPEEKQEQKPKRKSRWWGDALPDDE